MICVIVNGDPNGIRIESIGKRTASEIIFMVSSDVAAGEYLLQVRNRSHEEYIQMGTLPRSTHHG